MHNDTQYRDFLPHTEAHTEIYAANGTLIERLPGRVVPAPADYHDQLPIVYCHVCITTQVVYRAKIEKNNDNENYIQN